MFHNLFGRAEVDDTELYAVLGVDKGATSREITKAYRSLAMKHHPDKGGDDKKFKVITDAYEVLSNPERRKAYDVGGRTGSTTWNMDTMFTSMFSGSFPARENRVRPLVINVFVSLEEVCTGSRRSVAYHARRTCKTCMGTGGNASRDCQPCGGTGTKVMSRSLRPGMVQQVQSTCLKCGGKGKLFTSPCTPCDGAGHVRVECSVDIRIPPGIANGSKMVFREKGHSLENDISTNGDVMVGFQVKKHPVFTRVGMNDLHMTETITLLQALCGYTLIVDHLNGRPLKLVSDVPRGHDSVHVVKGSGLNSTGSLHVMLKVTFPTRAFTDAEARVLKTIL